MEKHSGFENIVIENERFRAKTDERLEEYGRKISKLESSNELLYKMSVLLEVQTDLNKEQQRQMKENTETLVGVNASLIKVNGLVEKLSQRLERLEEDVTNNRQRLNENDDKNHIDIRDSQKDFKEWLLKIPLIIAMAILAWALGKFGL